jgi:hypothetical protein
MTVPYDFSRVTPSIYGDRRPVEGEVVALLHVSFEDRGLKLIETKSRAVRLQEIHELMITDEDTSPGGGADRVRAIAFFEVDRSGLIVVGDSVTVDGEPLGKLAGFDVTHMPNHMNMVVKTPSLDEPVVRVGDKVRFSSH